MSYKKGRSFEYRVRRYYEKQGYLVIRSAGSKGIADLVAIKGDEVLLIQCKIRKYLNKWEKEQVKYWKPRVNAKFVLAWRKGKRKLVIEEIRVV